MATKEGDPELSGLIALQDTRPLFSPLGQSKNIKVSSRNSSTCARMKHWWFGKLTSQPLTTSVQSIHMISDDKGDV